MLDGMDASTAMWTSLQVSGDAQTARAAPSAPVVEVFERGDRVAAAVYGEIDFDIAPALQDALRTALARSIVGLDLELKRLTFCDGAGLRVLLRLRQEALAVGKTVRLCSASAPVARLLRITRTHGLFTPAEEGPESPCANTLDPTFASTVAEGHPHEH